MLLSVLLACSTAAPDTAALDTGRADTVEEEDTPLEQGESLYADFCASCHGTNGDTGYAADLSLVVPKLSEDELAAVIRHGVRGQMPGTDFTDEELALVVAYVSATWGG